MCLGTAYMQNGNEPEEIMQGVAQIKAAGLGFWLIPLSGEKKFFEGTIQNVNLMDGFFVIVNDRETIKT